jgi:hypothetical protein
VALLLAIALTTLAVCATSASADYGQLLTEHFGTTGEAEQLSRATAIAINTTGAGGVEPGSIYVVGEHNRVLRYGPGKEGEEPPFKEAWGWDVGEEEGKLYDEDEEYQRCGPALTTEPSQHTFHTCIPQGDNSIGANSPGEQTGHFSPLTGIAVDPVTGDVYIRDSADVGVRVRHLIEVFTATGTPIGEGFGEQGRRFPSPAESIAEGPGKLHAPGKGNADSESLAVGENGVVYVTDRDFENIANLPGEARVMSFAPEHPGDYAHYVYAGQSEDIAASAASVFEFSRIALVGEGRIVAASPEAIYEYALGGGSTPVCSYRVPGGQLWAMTANSVTGEVFYFTEAGGKIHRLSACNPTTGEFVELQASPLAVTPKTEQMAALAVNPVLSWGPLRPEGVLYAADQLEHSELAHVQHGIGDIFVPSKVFAPSVVAESVVGTTIDSTVLHAEVNPNGFTTSYRFQYVRGAVYSARKAQAEGEGKTSEEAVTAAFAGAADAPVGGGTLGAGGVGVATAGVGGLEAETEYRFRVIASSDCEGTKKPACVTSGETASFSTYPPVLPGLADGRAYELVSPPEKDGGEVFPAEPLVASCGLECKPESGAIVARFPMQSAPDGDTIAYMGDPFSTDEGAVVNEYLSKRTANGWQTSNLSPALQANKSGSVVFDTGLGRDLIYQESPRLNASAPAGYPNLYMQEAGAPSALTPLITTQPPDRSSSDFQLKFAGASVDLSRTYFSANDALTEETPSAPKPVNPGTFGSDLYEWHEGSLVLVNVLPGNTGVAEGAMFASAAGTDTLSPDAHAVSTDGSRVFWSAAGHLYVRVDGQETLEVASSGVFMAASADGMEVLLTNGLIYRFNQETGIYEQAVDLTKGQNAFQGILGTGEQE